jgi:hypothetical protein
MVKMEKQDIDMYQTSRRNGWFGGVTSASWLIRKFLRFHQSLAKSVLKK